MTTCTYVASYPVNRDMQYQYLYHNGNSRAKAYQFAPTKPPSCVSPNADNVLPRFVGSKSETTLS